jgi:hypothetical protein
MLRSAENGRTIPSLDDMVNENSTKSIVLVNDASSGKDSRVADIDYFRMLCVNLKNQSIAIPVKTKDYFEDLLISLKQSLSFNRISHWLNRHFY